MKAQHFNDLCEGWALFGTYVLFMFGLAVFLDWGVMPPYLW